MTNPFQTTTVSSGESTPLNIWRGDNDTDGNPVYVEARYDDYDVVRKGEYNLTISGLREPREQAIDPKYLKDSGPSHKTLTAIEFEVMDGPSRGKRFLIDFLTLNLSSGGGQYSPSNLYRVFSAALPSGGTNIGDMLHQSISAYVTVKLGDDGQPRYNKMTFESCEPVDVQADEVPAEFKQSEFKQSA